jgi:hypothetical protein
VKSRFSKALQCSTERGICVCEPKGIYNWYKSILKDPSRKPRWLKKGKVIRDFIVPLGLIGLEDRNFHFVAFTWDREDRTFLTPGAISDKLLPVFLDESGADRFHQMKSQVGWLGYKQLEEALLLGGNQEYMLARESMVNGNEPSEEYYGLAGR